MTHSGHCHKDCGHLLTNGHVKANPETQRHLDSDPRVTEYHSINGGEHFEFLFAPNRDVAPIHRARARQLRIQELS